MMMMKDVVRGGNVNKKYILDCMCVCVREFVCRYNI